VLKLERGLRPASACQQSRDLLSGWQLTDTAPGAWPDPAAADQAQPAWLDLPGLGPVGQLLRELGDPRLSSPGFRVDALDWWYRLAFDADADLVADLVADVGADAGAAEAVAHALADPAGDVAAETALSSSWALCMDGLATVAEVWLNGQPLPCSANMHRARRWPLRGVLQAGRNVLWIACRALDAHLALRRPRPRWRAPMIEHQQLRWVRTTLLGRTPGWSPSVPVVGPWRWVGLVRPEPLAPQLERWVADWGPQGARLDLSCRFPAPDGAQPTAVWAELRLNPGDAPLSLALAPGAANGDGQAWAVDASVPDAQPWWPHTHGEPVRYALSLSAQYPGGVRVFQLGHTGFRRIELDTAQGGFAVKVNGLPVFCRGACWTPINVDTLDAPDARDYARSMAQVCEAGLNMLRVGGTMAYEADAFYDACDARGVLIWQDLMFANMDYPEDAAFVSEVEAEVRQQLRRWQGRPSLAVVCGNSEVSQQAAMFGALRELWSPALFSQTLPQWVQGILPDVPYWASSAFGGAFPHQNDQGTTSYYGVGAYQREPEDARRSGLKFATECLAFANVPEPDGLADLPGGLALRCHHPAWKAGTPRDLGAGWDFEDVRDHYVGRLYGVDPARLRYSDHERYLALGRAAVGEVFGLSMAEWRRQGSGCGGALVWFWRDLRPGAGWGVLDSAGRPKSAYHALKRGCQPRSLSFTDESGNGWRLHLNNERPQDVAGSLSLMAWKDGETLVAQARRDVLVPARSVVALDWAACFDWFADWSWFYRFGPLGAHVLMAVWHDVDGQELARAHALPGGLALPCEPDLGLKAVILCADAQEAWVELGTRRFAQSVHWDVPGWVPEAQHFHLAPGQLVQVRFVAHPGSRARPFAGSVLALNALHAVAIGAAVAAGALAPAGGATA
jgi:beta-mannosidase